MNKFNETQSESELRHISSWLKYIITVLHEYSTFRIGALIGLLLIIIFMPQLFQKYGALLILGALLFLLLWYLDNLIDKQK